MSKLGRVAILGGYTTYGKQIATYLAKSSKIKRLLIAGKNVQLAAGTVHRLNSSKAQWAHADVSSLVNFSKFLYEDAPEIVINAKRTQLPEIAKICLDKGVHYIDTTDSTEIFDEEERYEKFYEELIDLAVKNKKLCITEASLNPGFTSAVIDSYTNKFQKIDSCNIYISPDEGLAANVFQYIGVDGGFRSLTKYKENYYGQIFEPSMEKMKNNLNIPEINCHYCFHSRLLRKGSQMLSFFPDVDKEKIYEKIVSQTEFFKKQEPNVEIVVRGTMSNGEEREEIWNLSESQNLTPFSISSIPACLIVEKILDDQIEGQHIGKVSPCINLFTLDEVEKLMPLFESHIEEINYASVMSDDAFQTTDVDKLQDQFIALVYWIETTKGVLNRCENSTQEPLVI